MVVFLISVFAVLLPVFIINFVYDPGDIYFQRMLKVKYSEDYVSQLMASPFGVRAFGNERLIKGVLARKTGNINTVILGSSHAMQIGHVRMPKFRRSFGDAALNLSVSGGTLEDIMIFSHIILSNTRLPEKLLIEVSPWSLKWAMDERYMIYQGHLDGMLSELELKRQQHVDPYWLKLLSNAVSYEYFKQSIKRAIDPTFKIIPENHLKEYGPVAQFDHAKGYAFGVTLNDGSYVYDKGYIEKLRSTKDYMEDLYYKLEGRDYDENCIIAFKKLLDLLRVKGIKVYFLLAPYNPMLYQGANQAVVDRLARVESRIREMAKEANIKVFGSYDPRENGLVQDDFFDLMHAKVTGLDKIDFSH
jgi:hypothetical protein